MGAAVAAAGVEAAAAGAVADRVGLGWRPELAPAILARLDLIDVVEVIADDYLEADAKTIRSLQTLARLVPMSLHGVSLGLATTSPVEERRLQRFARLVGQIEPEAWSEHLAFVRAGGVELGHLAAPPRRESVIDGTAANVEAARRAIGARPLLENIATLIDPPASTMTEATWVQSTLAAADAKLVLDLHNLHANATNHCYDPFAFLDAIPIERVEQIHMAGGRWIEADPQIAGRSHRRLLDDHLHDVPDAAYELLAAVAERADRPLTVILERDGSYPPFASLLGEITRIREAVALGRARNAAGSAATTGLS